MAGINNRIRLLESEDKVNTEWEMRSLEKSSSLLKYGSFFLFSLPLLVSVTSPHLGGELWYNLSLVPDWFKNIWVGMMGTIWGLATLKDHGITIKSIIGK